jgi:hypothetical protein
MDGHASIVARNMSGTFGAVCGGYPGQYVAVKDHASIDVAGSSARMWGGGILAHNLSFTGAFNVRTESNSHVPRVVRAHFTSRSRE